MRRTVKRRLAIVLGVLWIAGPAAAYDQTRWCVGWGPVIREACKDHDEGRSVESTIMAIQNLDSDKIPPEMKKIGAKIVAVTYERRDAGVTCDELVNAFVQGCMKSDN